jgi:membrane associated rhomboid family serine protease
MSTIAQVLARTRSPVRTILLGLLLLAGGLAIFLFGWPFYSVWPTNGNLAYNAVLAAGFGLLAAALHAYAPLRRYGTLAYIPVVVVQRPALP